MGRRGPGSSADAGRPACRSATRCGAAGGRARPPARWPRVAGTAVTPPPTIGPPSTPRHPLRSGAIRIPPAKPGQSGFCIFRVAPALGPPAGIRPRAVGSGPLGGKGADARRSKLAVIGCFGSAAGAPFRAENWAALTLPGTAIGRNWLKIAGIGWSQLELRRPVRPRVSRGGRRAGPRPRRWGSIPEVYVVVGLPATARAGQPDSGATDWGTTWTDRRRRFQRIDKRMGRNGDMQPPAGEIDLLRRIPLGSIPNGEL